MKGRPGDRRPVCDKESSVAGPLENPHYKLQPETERQKQKDRPNASVVFPEE